MNYMSMANRPRTQSLVRLFFVSGFMVIETPNAFMPLMEFADDLIKDVVKMEVMMRFLEYCVGLRKVFSRRFAGRWISMPGEVPEIRELC